MMSLQSSTHSSQTNTDGPAISLRTSCWLLPQKEQYSNLPSSCLPRESSDMRHLRDTAQTGGRASLRRKKPENARMQSDLYITRGPQPAKTQVEHDSRTAFPGG